MAEPLYPAPPDVRFWLTVKRSDLQLLRQAVRRGSIAPDKLDAILGVLRQVRTARECKPHLQRAIDSFFAFLELTYGDNNADTAAC